MKQSIFKSLLLIASLLVFTQHAAQAQEADKTVTLVVNGQGKTPDEAKQNALRSAIEQAFGAFISSPFPLAHTGCQQRGLWAVADVTPTRAG